MYAERLVFQRACFDWYTVGLIRSERVVEIEREVVVR
jgi:hypothetical protein